MPYSADCDYIREFLELDDNIDLYKMIETIANYLKGLEFEEETEEEEETEVEPAYQVEMVEEPKIVEKTKSKSKKGNKK